MNTRNASLKRFGSPGIVVIVLVVYSGGCTVDFGIGTDDPDARSPDAVVEDAAPPDGALSDAEPVDAAPQDAGPVDAGQQDAAVTCSTTR